jgi:hypothetical protein
MPLLTSAIRSDVRGAMEVEVHHAARAMCRGVERTDHDVRAELHAQARAGDLEQNLLIPARILWR